MGAAACNRSIDGAMQYSGTVAYAPAAASSGIICMASANAVGTCAGACIPREGFLTEASQLAIEGVGL